MGVIIFYAHFFYKYGMVQIKCVQSNSVSAKHGIKAGDYILSVNGHDINDVLDYSYYTSERNVVLKIHRESDIFDIKIKKEEYQDLGLEFESYLMDKKHCCKNKCVFCFIDQNPKGMRDTIYFKDDDSRLSFLQGSYVTLTNMSEGDLSRIVKMKTSPINVSVHTANPTLRVKMLNNKNAGKIMEQLKILSDGGIKLNCQIVLCKGLNDGAELERSMQELSALYPSVQSVSVVPAGLTRHREGLYPLEAFSTDEAKKVIEAVEAYAKACRKKLGTRLFWCSDEFYIKARLPIHSDSYYEGYPQLENGVGLITSLKTEVDACLDEITTDETVSGTVSVATGTSAYDFIFSLCQKIMLHIPNLKINVYKIKNNFFGESVTVAGLITGQDLCAQLSGKELGERLCLTSDMLKADEEVFLDGYTPRMCEEKLGVKLSFADNSGESFLNTLIGR